MDAAAATNFAHTIQASLQTMAILHLTSFYYPQQAEVKNNSFFDFIIVGGGTAGCVLARRLVEDGKSRVLLVEAGEDPPFQTDVPQLIAFLSNTSIDWNYTMTTDQSIHGCCKNNEFGLSLGKMLGGSGSLDHLNYNEGSRHDFDRWAAAVNDSSWNGDGVLPYFIKSQNVREATIKNSADKSFFGFKGPIDIVKDKTTGAINFLKAFRELGHRIVKVSSLNKTLGYTTGMVSMGNGKRQHTAYAYLRCVKNNPNLFVLKNTFAKRILFNDDKRAISVQVVTEDNKIYVLRASKEIIVCAGVVNTPKLLMLSGIGPGDHLTSKGIETIVDLPVGKNFIDQPSVVLIHNLTKVAGKERPFDPCHYPGSAVTGFVSLNKSESNINYQGTCYLNYRNNEMIFCKQTYGYSDYICNNLFDPRPFDVKGNGNIMVFSLVTNLYPVSRGEVC